MNSLGNCALAEIATVAQADTTRVPVICAASEVVWPSDAGTHVKVVRESGVGEDDVTLEMSSAWIWFSLASACDASIAIKVLTLTRDQGRETR